MPGSSGAGIHLQAADLAALVLPELHDRIEAGIIGDDDAFILRLSVRSDRSQYCHQLEIQCIGADIAADPGNPIRSQFHQAAYAVTLHMRTVFAVKDVNVIGLSQTVHYARNPDIIDIFTVNKVVFNGFTTENHVGFNSSSLGMLHSSRKK